MENAHFGMNFCLPSENNAPLFTKKRVIYYFQRLSTSVFIFSDKFSVFMVKFFPLLLFLSSNEVVIFTIFSGRFVWMLSLFCMLYSFFSSSSLMFSSSKEPFSSLLEGLSAKVKDLLSISFRTLLFSVNFLTCGGDILEDRIEIF